MKDRGMVHLYVGDGKGKSTAAVGLAVRARGQGLKALLCQFLKSGKSGEILMLEQLGVQIVSTRHNGKFTFQMTDAERETTAQNCMAALDEILRLLEQASVDLIILDEVVDAVNAGLIPLDALLRFLRARPPHTEAVLTGRNPDPAIEAQADYYTEFRCRAHPYQQGAPARQGIEF